MRDARAAGPALRSRVRSGDAETERVSGGVEEHAEGRPRLVLVLRRAELEHGGLCRVEVVDRDVDVHLLRYLLPGPARGGVLVHLLEPDGVAVVGADLSPVRGNLDLPLEEGAVEPRERTGVGAVDDDAGKAGDGHDGHRRGSSWRSVSGPGRGGTSA